jgi:hypothetical protein
MENVYEIDFPYLREFHDSLSRTANCAEYEVRSVRVRHSIVAGNLRNVRILRASLVDAIPLIDPSIWTRK